MSFRYSLLLTMVILAMLCGCKKKQPLNVPNDLQQFNLKGKVKSISEINYSTTGKYHTRILFNEKGFITEQTSYNPDGTLIRKWINDYDKDIYKTSRHCYVLNDSLSYILRYYYNRQGKLIWTKLFNARESLISIYSTEYDDSLNIIKETLLGEDANFKHLVVHSYNSQNKIEEDIFIDSVRNKTWKQMYRYNNQSQVEEITIKSPNDSLIKKTKYTYLINNKIDKAFHYTAHLALESITAYSYDSLDNIVSMTELSPDKVPLKEQTYQYNYDQQGNWTFLSESINHQPGNIITRSIEYYN